MNGIQGPITLHRLREFFLARFAFWNIYLILDRDRDIASTFGDPVSMCSKKENEGEIEKRRKKNSESTNSTSQVELVSWERQVYHNFKVKIIHLKSNRTDIAYLTFTRDKIFTNRDPHNLPFFPLMLSLQ